jgi:hypothetical protein
MASNPNEVLSKNPARDGVNGQKEGSAEEKKGGASVFSRMKGLVTGLAIAATIAAPTSIALSSCGENDSNPPVPSLDASVDGGDTDTTTDSGSDTDTGSDTGTDTDSGTQTDSGTDTDSGTQTDSGTDTDSGTVTDSGTDTDSGPALCAEALAVEGGTFEGYMVSGTPQTVGGYVIEYLGKNGSGDALFRISCGGDVVEASFACPIGLETEKETAEGRKISITPISANATVSHATVSVETI